MYQYQYMISYVTYTVYLVSFIGISCSFLAFLSQSQRSVKQGQMASHGTHWKTNMECNNEGFESLKMMFLCTSVIFRFHVYLPGCHTQLNIWVHPARFMRRGAEAACLREPRRAAWARNLGAGHRCITPDQADLKKHRGKMMKVWNSCLVHCRGKQLLFLIPVSHHIPWSVLQWGREGIHHLRPTSTTSIEMHRVSMFIKLYHQYSASFTNKSSHAWHTTCLFHSCALMMRVGKLDSSFER